MKTYDKAAAYQAVMDRIREVIELPPNRSPQSWLAEQLGVARQLSYVWQTNGIPKKHVAEIAKLLDMDPMVVCPSLEDTYLPKPVFHAILESSTKTKPFGARLVELLKIGLGQSYKTFHGTPKSASLTKSVPADEKLSRAPEQPMKAVAGFVPISAEEMQTQREEALKAGADLSVKGRAK